MIGWPKLDMVLKSSEGFEGPIIRALDYAEASSQSRLSKPICHKVPIRNGRFDLIYLPTP